MTDSSEEIVQSWQVEFEDAPAMTSVTVTTPNGLTSSIGTSLKGVRPNLSHWSLLAQAALQSTSYLLSKVRAPDSLDMGEPHDWRVDFYEEKTEGFVVIEVEGQGGEYSALMVSDDDEVPNPGALASALQDALNEMEFGESDDDDEDVIEEARRSVLN